jgi:hypothetical protein
MVDYFSSALVEVLAKADLGVWSPIQSVGAQFIRTRPGSELAVVSEASFCETTIVSQSRFSRSQRLVECHQVREAFGWTCKDCIDPGWTMSVPL